MAPLAQAVRREGARTSRPAVEEKNEDLFWQIRPLVCWVLESCKLPRKEHVCIDEQIMPFTGRTQLKQFVQLGQRMAVQYSKSGQAA